MVSSRKGGEVKGERKVNKKRNLRAECQHFLSSPLSLACSGKTFIIPLKSRPIPRLSWLRVATHCSMPWSQKNHWAHHVAEMNKMTTHHRGAARLRALALGDGPSRRIPCSVSTLRLKNAKVPILLHCQHHRATGPVRQMASPFTLKRSQITMSRWKQLLLRQLSAKSLLG